MSQNKSRIVADKATECSETFRDVRAEAPNPRAKRSEAFQDVPRGSETFAQMESSQTKPSSPPTAGRPLSPRQLAAARILIRGGSSADVAHALATTPQTINRWRRCERFAAEIRRLHELIAVAQGLGKVERAPRRLPAPHQPAPRGIDPNGPEQMRFEAMMNQLLGPPQAR